MRAPHHRIVDRLLTVRAVAVAGLQLGVDLLQQRQRRGGGVRARVGRRLGQDRMRIGIDRQVNISPVAPLVDALLADFPLAFAVDLQPRAVHTTSCSSTSADELGTSPGPPGAAVLNATDRRTCGR